MKKLLICCFIILFIFSCKKGEKTITPYSAISPEYVILISANAEWKTIKEVFPNECYLKSPWGEYFNTKMNINSRQFDVVFFHGGWGKIAAAGSTQYVIDKFSPEFIINLGTCGGFEGKFNNYRLKPVDWITTESS